MIIPQYWAQASGKVSRPGGRDTLLRFGWSLESQHDAEQIAQQRLEAAIAQWQSGEQVELRERRVSYGGSDGVPIREEVLERRGEAVLTRNGYGASCLNVPDLVFADVDFTPPTSVGLRMVWIVGLLGAAALTLGVAKQNGWLMLPIALVVWFVSGFLTSWQQKRRQRALGDPQELFVQRVKELVAGRPEWRLRVYRTPAGMRVIVSQQRMKPDDVVVQQLFGALGVDPVYARMCSLQQCFRARVSPKPWRIGLSQRPRGGVWPVAQAMLAEREQWVRDYQQRAASYASCTLVADVGSAEPDPALLPLIEWHDSLSRATQPGLPLA